MTSPTTSATINYRSLYETSSESEFEDLTPEYVTETAQKALEEAFKPEDPTSTIKAIEGGSKKVVFKVCSSLSAPKVGDIVLEILSNQSFNQSLCTDTPYELSVKGSDRQSPYTLTLFIR